MNQLQLNDTYIPAKTLLVDQQTSQGLEIHGTFGRITGKKQMSLQFVNRSQKQLMDFAIQFNTNTFGLSPDNLQVPILAPNQSHTTTIELNYNNSISLTSPLNSLQLAFKSNLGVFYSQTDIPLHLLFNEQGGLDQKDYLSYWRNIDSNQEVKQSVTNIKPIPSTEWLRNKLHKNNVFTVADRNINNKTYMFISCTLDDNTLFLLELTFEGVGATNCNLAIKLVPNTGSLGSNSIHLIPLFYNAVNDILKS
ncbi:clathrin adaptor appendage domain-containing protein [Neoconidiobolus thromboides FSU 785]|nr:clathrin adaptor appendage domain-containing protein [Neoconidiobolus thromboides FSU 785]